MKSLPTILVAGAITACSVTWMAIPLKNPIPSADAAGSIPRAAVPEKNKQRDAAGNILNSVKLPVPASKPTHYVDADTFDLPTHPFIGWTVPVRIRVSNVNAPETRGAKATTCDREKQLAAQATAMTAALLNDPGAVIELSSVDGFDRNDRYLATVTVNGKDLGEMLVEVGLARVWTEKYEGQTKSYWCSPPAG